jgi:hypothetical protein
MRDLTFGFRGIYRAQDEVIEDGSFDDGTTYFLFNPGRRGTGNFTTTEDLACNDPAIGCFGPARRYYRALEFTATKRFSNNYQFIASYVFSSLIGNYEGLFRNDNGHLTRTSLRCSIWSVCSMVFTDDFQPIARISSSLTAATSGHSN